MPTMKDKDLLKLLLSHGWQEVSVRGSHHKLKKGDKTLVVPVHNKDMRIGLLNAIRQAAGLPPLH